MAVASATAEKVDLPGTMEPSLSKLPSDVASESSSAANPSFTADSPDRNDSSNSSPSPSRDVDALSPSSLRSEEYRQLFRLPSEEVLVQDFNCAFQESILLQGHMYLFVHYICFYSNIFGFETKKIIPFNEVTSVKRAKTAGIFPNAIEIFAGGRKYFFASFLSRDEAFKLINDGWMHQSNEAKEITEQQELISESSSQENGFVAIERVNSSRQIVNEPDSVIRDKDAPTSSDSMTPPNVENNIEQDPSPVQIVDSSLSVDTTIWKLENCDAPNIPESYTKVAETNFPIKVEEFFNLYFSDNAVSFAESFHKRCGDKEFRCSSWYPHAEFGHARDVSFQHPIKFYFGAKFGSCQVVQKFRVYRNSHLVVEASQEINDVPYGDYFRVEGLWDVVENDDASQEGCILRVYVNVAFSKNTVWKGKIVQSTLEECREAYAMWIDMAHEVFKNQEKQEGVDPPPGLTQNGEIRVDGDAMTQETTNRSHNSSDQTRTSQMSGSSDFNLQGNISQGSLITATSITSFLTESIRKVFLFVESHSRISQVLAVAFAVIFLMQVSIILLLNRPQHIHVNYPMEYMGGMPSERSAEAIAWLEKRLHHLKDEMLMAEARLERMQHEHTLLKTQLKELEHPRKRKQHSFF